MLYFGSDNIDFGDVILETDRVVCMQLHNVSPIAAEWAVRSVMRRITSDKRQLPL